MKLWMLSLIHILPLIIPYNKVHGANMGPIWGRQDPGGPHVDLINFAIWDGLLSSDIWSALVYQAEYKHFCLCCATEYLIINM